MRHAIRRGDACKYCVEETTRLGLRTRLCSSASTTSLNVPPKRLRLISRTSTACLQLKVEGQRIRHIISCRYVGGRSGVDPSVQTAPSWSGRHTCPRPRRTPESPRFWTSASAKCDYPDRDISSDLAQWLADSHLFFAMGPEMLEQIQHLKADPRRGTRTASGRSQ